MTNDLSIVVRHCHQPSWCHWPSSRLSQHHDVQEKSPKGWGPPICQPEWHTPQLRTTWQYWHCKQHQYNSPSPLQIGRNTLFTPHQWKCDFTTCTSPSQWKSRNGWDAYPLPNPVKTLAISTWDTPSLNSMEEAQSWTSEAVVQYPGACFWQAVLKSHQRKGALHHILHYHLVLLWGSSWLASLVWKILRLCTEPRTWSRVGFHWGIVKASQLCFPMSVWCTVFEHSDLNQASFDLSKVSQSVTN